MSRRARHLQVLEESKREEYNPIEKPSKTRSELDRVVQDARDDEYKAALNTWAQSLNYTPPNKMSYEMKKGGKRRRSMRKKTRGHRKSKRRHR